MGTTEAKAKPAQKKAAPAQRKTTSGRSPEAARAQAWAGFEARAQAWLLRRPDRVVMLPDELPALVAACGVPCGKCRRVVNHVRENSHTVWWQRVDGGHWAAGVSVDCRVS